MLQVIETWNDREMIRNQLVLIELMIPRIIEHYFFELVRHASLPEDTPLSNDTAEFLRAVYQPSYFRSLGNFFRRGWFQDLCLFLQKTDFKESIETLRRNFVDFHQQRHALRKEEDALLKGTIVPLKKLLKEKERYSRKTQDLLSLCWASNACGFPYNIRGLKRAKIAPGLINNGLSILFRRYAIFELLEREHIIVIIGGTERVMIFFEYRCSFRGSQLSSITTKENVALIHENYCYSDKKSYAKDTL